MSKEFLDQLLESKSFYPDEPQERRVQIAASLLHNVSEANAADFPTEEISDEMVFEQVNGRPLTISVEATENGDLLRFRNAILAQAETNKNNDTISPENINELAATLAGRAIDISHDEFSNAGIITAARSILYKGNPAVAIDGIGWRDRYPTEWDGVRAGTHHLSVEADAEKAVCSICKGEFEGPKDYCTHLKGRRLSGAKRGFIGLTGKGAGITPDPAGTDTHFDRDQIFVVAHQEVDLDAAQESPTGESDQSLIENPKLESSTDAEIVETVQETQMDKCPRCNADVEADVKTCPSCHKGMEASVIAAELKASEDQVAANATEIEAKKKELADAMAELETLKPLQAKVDETEAAKVLAETDKQAAETKLAEKTAELEAAQATLQASQTKLAEIKATQREAEIKPLLTEDAWNERKDKFQSMDDEMFATVAASLRETAKKPAQAQIGLRSGMPELVAGSENGQRKITLRK